jgi:hypothetical protein
MPKKTATESLTGKELLQKVKELDNLSREEKARACGYVSTTKNGRERVNMMQFYNAVIEAEGIKLDGKQRGRGTGRGGRTASYRTSVQASGNLLIGPAYTKQMDLKPGDQFEVSMGRKHIHLKQIDTTS